MEDAAACGDLSVIYLAGGCFWGLEKVFSMIPGVIRTECGYANGYSCMVPNYITVCSGKFGHCETVKICYDQKAVSLERLLDAFFMVIDPTLLNRQGNDRGVQYRTGIYWEDSDSGRKAEAYVENERKRYNEFFTETGPLANYFPAEEKHQGYLDRNPEGYCHIPREEFERIRNMFSGG
ncbi:MAG: peptide-methionine (S)-S-oxide reductase MsrA [Methanomassiliicoccaceae archaeon]|nr:peptide-methionine (S)-S-oxide reductase MsrA [Methanomassiliicoccaceae archaeon]